MNNIQLKIKLTSVNTEYVGQDAKIVAFGEAKFQFYNNGKMNTRLINYQAYGQTALSFQSAGKDSVHVVSGKLNIYPPSDNNPNHSMVLNISQAVLLSLSNNQAPVSPKPQPVTQTIDESIPF